MDRHTENHYKHVLTGMAATTSEDESESIKGQKRFSDCYTYVANTIKTHRDNQTIQDGKIRVYTFGKKPAHCVLLDKNNDVIADKIHGKRKSYDVDSGSIMYENDAFPKNVIMGKSLALTDNSIEFSVKDFEKLIDNIDLLVDIKKEDDPNLNFIHLKNKGMSIDESITSIELTKELQSLEINNPDNKNDLKKSNRIKNR